MAIKKRVLVSYDDICPFQCKHCYTLDIKREKNNRSINEIIDGISSDDFDVVYVSQRRDNFSNPDLGIELCEKLFDRYKCNIFIITRNIFDEEQIRSLCKLRERMNSYNKDVIVAVSLFATNSYSISENQNKVPTPEARIYFLNKIAESGIKAIALIRPVFPNKIVNVKELYEIIDSIKSFISCVVSSGLAVNDNILWRLGMNSNDFSYASSNNYLEGVMEGELKFIDVSEELLLVKNYCIKNEIPYFEHTMPALDYLLNT